MLPRSAPFVASAFWWEIRMTAPLKTGPTSANEIRPAASFAPTQTYRSRPKKVYDSSDPARRCFVSSMSRTSSRPALSSMKVSVPLSGVTTYCPPFVLATTERRSVPTPGSTTETKTVPAGQNGMVCRNRYAASQTEYSGMSCVRSNMASPASTPKATPFMDATAPSLRPKSVWKTSADFAPAVAEQARRNTKNTAMQNERLFIANILPICRSRRRARTTHMYPRRPAKRPVRNSDNRERISPGCRRFPKPG